MKKLHYIIPLLLGMALTSCYDEDIEKINSRLDAIENTQIATISQQITSINNSILLLNGTDKELNAYITALEKEAENLQTQITTTNTKIDEVKTEVLSTISTEKANILAELEAFSATVNGELDAIKAVLETLKAKDAELDGKIATLQEYVDTELKETEDWATATFSTLEQYNDVVATIATIEGTIEGINESIAALETRINEKIAKDIETACATLSADLQNAVKDVAEAYTSAIATAKTELTEAYTAAFKAAIATSEASMKEWVNEQLTGYYTIAQMDAKLEALQNSLTEGDGALQKEIDALRESLAAQNTELTEAYTAAITEAINTNNGVFEGKIAEAIGKVNEQIAGLEERINTLEERLSAVEDAIEQIKALDITFDTTESIACMAGASVTIGYTITGGDSKTAIEAWGDGGWSATVLPESTTTGKIKVTAPEKATNGKVVVLATSGAGGVAMRSLHFEEGILTGILDTYKVGWEACTLDVTLRTNLDYVVEIPTEAQSWLSVAGTRATVRNETLTFTIAENSEDMPTRSVVVQLVSLYGEVLQSFEIVQDLQPLSTPIEFADQYVKKVCVEKFDTNGDGELSYKEASMVTYIPSDFFGDYGSAVKSFEELQYFINLTSIRNAAFRGCKSLTSITIPDSVTSIGSEAFYICYSLTSVTIGNSVTKIGDYAFDGCKSLTSITIPDGVTSIGRAAFFGCYSLTSITIPNSVTSIGTSAFENCTSLTSVTIPDSVTSIGNLAFYGCSSLTSVYITDIGAWCKIDFDGTPFSTAHNLYLNGELVTDLVIPENIFSIKDYAFLYCSSLTSITIPDSVVSIGDYAFRDCTSLTSIAIPDSVTTIGSNAFNKCSSLVSVYCKPTTPPTGGSYMFGSNASGRKIYVPTASVEAYKAAKYWSDYATSIVGYDF